MVFVLHLGFGWSGVFQLMTFFALGTGSSKLGYQIKQKKGTAQEIRTWRNAAANAGVGAFLAFLAWCLSSHEVLLAIGMVGSFSAATSDTVSGEIGRLYGKNPRMITTFRPARTGENGAVSLIGILAGLVSAFAIAGIGSATHLFPGPKAFVVTGLAGFGGNLVDSFLGATLENRGIMGNETVNFFCTCSGATLAMLGYGLY